MRTITLLCIASYEKGADFLREAKRLGCRVLLLTTEKLGDADWPRESIDEVFLMPDLYDREAVTNGVSYLARTERIDRIVPLDEFDLEVAAHLREHLRLPGLGESATRYFRDKLAMRMRAHEAGIRVPEFIGIFNHDDVRAFLADVPGPWLLKPRTQASAIGIRKIERPDELWRALDELGDRQSHHLLERFLPGDVYHVDSIVAEGDVRFAEAHRYAAPPFEVMHGGGIFATRTLERDSEEAREVLDVNHALVLAFGLWVGALHTEFIRARHDGRIYFLETAARVGGANIVDVVEAATGVNLWREWARAEIADVRGDPYGLEPARRTYAGILISLARQEWPDTSAYDDPEIVWRMSKKHHAGLLVASPEPARVEELLQDYMRRFYTDFHASLPAPERPTA
ncbi:MAG TPA: hypothetical protein VFQ38_15730 [Longimicrobiales bacterium]|nr:hypothetical protein [Longimicrobiales bacterium]